MRTVEVGHRGSRLARVRVRERVRLRLRLGVRLGVRVRVRVRIRVRARVRVGNPNLAQDVVAALDLAHAAHPLVVPG